MNRILAVIFGLVAALGITGCGGDDGDGDASTAPDISALSFDPGSIPSGQQTVVTGRLSFSDPDGDVDHLTGVFALGETRQMLAPVPITGVDRVTEGEVTFQLLLQPPAAMPLTVEVWLVDAEGNASNHLSGEIAVTAP